MNDPQSDDLEQSVTAWIDGLKQGSNDSAQELWERYFSQLVQLARARLPNSTRRDFDEEDIAISAFHSLCHGVRNRKFPRLDDRNNLWSLLVVITARKAANRQRAALSQKRGAGTVQGESGFFESRTADADVDGVHHIVGREPTPALVAEFSDECEFLLKQLPDEHMRQIALMKLAGYENSEIATKAGCGLRTIERRLGLIRRIWTERA